MNITDDILIKEISGNASNEEILLITEWINSSPNHKAHYNRLKLIWDNATIKDPNFSPDVNDAWKSVSKKINQKSSFIILKIAASLIFIIVLGILINFIWLNTNAKDGTIVSQNDSEISTDNTSDKNVTNIKTFNVTTKDSIKELLLQDSSLVILNSNSEINYKDFFASNKRKIYLNGQAHFDIIPNKKDFIVATKYVIVKVLGTTFTVNENKEEQTIDIIVEEGKVEAYEINKIKNKVFITASEKYTYDIKSHTFTKTEHHKKKHWWKNFFSKFKKLLDRIKHRKTKKE